METLENRLQKRIHVSLYALLFLTTLLGLSVLLEGCTDKCEVTREYVYFEPVYTTVEEIRSSVALEPAQTIGTVGKIYFKDGILYVNEPGEGIHIINNQNPANPVQLKFLKIPGNYDLAIKGNTLYADSYVDLVAFDVSDLSNIREVNRVEGVFKNYQIFGYSIDENCCVITNFERKESVYIDESDCTTAPIQTWGSPMNEGGPGGIVVRADMAANFSTMAAIAPGSGSGSGVGGSLARFTISGNHLYLLDGADLHAVNIANETNPVPGSRTQLGWDIETIFPYEQNLFVGSMTGMHILDISSPESPVTLSTFQHVTSCDPVVVEGDYAYVTLRTGNFCAGNVNQLDVVDISDLRNPQLVKTYPMTNPHGLGIDDHTLFVCDGAAGLKAYDATDVNAIDRNLIAHHQGINAVDVIPFNNVLMMIGEDGIFQYDYSNPKELKILSKISVSNE
ncbi:MAG TPA: hypothetical protein VFT90_10100 [Chryseosolibacter sp.]|nr:hypothetical protein [Chryseosolibacter sp.]